MKGWLDNYGEEINANEGHSSAPKEWMGEGYSNVGRDYSPAWGGQFATGGSLPDATGFMYARTGAPSEGPYAKKTLPSAQKGLTFEQITGIKPITSVNNKTDNFNGVSLQEKQRQIVETQKMLDRNRALAKRQFIGTGTPTTKESEARRKTLTQQAVSNMPNVSYDEATGTTSAINPNMTYEGQPANFMGERQQKSVDHILGALEAAGYVTGAGELASAGYNALKPIIAESMESGLLSKAHKLNPWAFKPNSEAYYRGIGKEGLEDAMKSGVFRQAGVESGTPHFNRVWYATGDDGFGRASAFSNGYVAEVPKTSFPDASADFFKNSLGVETRATSKQIPITEGNILKKDWLQGYKKVPTPTNSSSYPSFKSITGNPEYIDQEYLSSLIKKETDWLRSKEYIKRKMASTGKSEEAIRKESEKIINNINNTSIEYTGKGEDWASGLYDPGGSSKKPKISIFNSDVDYPFYEGVLRHETAHGFSEMGNPSDNLIRFFKNEGYRNYPKVNLNKTIGDRISSMFGQNWANLAPEQQVTGRRMMDIIEETQGLKRGTELTEDNVKGLIDHLKNDEYNTADSDVFEVMSKFKRKFGDRYSKQLTDFLNKAYVIPGIGVGAAATYQAEKKKQGGVVKDDNGYWNPDNWGKVVEIGSPDITMEGVYDPLIGESKQTGEKKLMLPGKNYKFANTKQVIERPVAKNGINQQDEKVDEQLDQLTNFTNYNKPTKGGWLDKYN